MKHYNKPLSIKISSGEASLMMSQASDLVVSLANESQVDGRQDQKEMRTVTG